MEFDDILLDVGDYGRYQLFILCGFILPVCLFAGIHSFIQLFQSVTPKSFRCHIPELEHFNATMQLIGIPRSVKQFFYESESPVYQYDQCTMFTANYTALHGILHNSPNSSATNVTQSPIAPCQSGWIYQNVQIHSVVTEFDLVCSRDWLVTLALVCFTLGSVCGLLVFGLVSDYFGRKITIFMILALQAIFGLLSSFAPNFAAWCTCRFFIGLTVPSSLRIPMIYAIELVRPEKRTRVGILSTASYAVGTIMLAGLAYILPEWRRLSLATSLPELVLLLAWFFIPESPRWLLAKHRSVEIKDFLRFTAQVNGKILGSNTLNKLDLILDHEAASSNAAKTSPTFFDLFRLPNLRKKTFLITFIWFSNISVYMGLSYYSPTLGGSSLFLSYLLSMVMEIPAYGIVWFVTEKLGRRLPLCVAMICGGVLCVITVALPEKNPDAILVMYLLGKFCISASFFVICVYAGELYPTVVRGIGLATSATFATLGVCLGPVIIHIGKDYMTLPLVIFGIFAILGGFAPLFLPETWHQKLPETLAEGEEFGSEAVCFNLFKLKTYESTKHQPIPGMIGASETKEKSSSLVTHSLEKDDADDELAFERKAHLRSFPSIPQKKAAVRLNSATYLMSKQDRAALS
ncbi:beta-alanine transporter-like [Paramacrobiotus metropolitanus]|uniref:beta-alanine transporter-like n=1 Tax=Paramacrobiotus metropolitanus TaxID=2943436 RepID=UPI0024456E5B|nr:beta-alanine transporter-like [Paramacrobiotus metropolitanus]